MATIKLIQCYSIKQSYILMRFYSLLKEKKQKDSLIIMQF